MGTMMVTLMLERTRRALALISWLGSYRDTQELSHRLHKQDGDDAGAGAWWRRRDHAFIKVSNNVSLPLTLAEMLKWRAERGPAALRRNAPSKHRPAFSPAGRKIKSGTDSFNPNYVDEFDYIYQASYDVKWLKKVMKTLKKKIMKLQNCSSWEQDKTMHIRTNTLIKILT